MTHLDEAHLLAIRDGDPGEHAQGEQHLAGCAPCRDALQRLRDRSAAIAQALNSLDVVHDVADARARVRQRVTEGASGTTGAIPLTHRGRFWSTGLSRAAGILLVTAAAASALPGSPLRTWVSELIGPNEEAAVSGAPSALAPDDVVAGGETAGVRLALVSGPLRVSLSEVAPGSELRVQWVSGAEAAVFAPVGSRFTSAEGRIEAAVTPGPVRVELPRGLVPVSLEVNGRIYLTSTSSGLEIPGPAEERGPEEIVFRLPEA
jgi:hypothetical protein